MNQKKKFITDIFHRVLTIPFLTYYPQKKIPFSMRKFMIAMTPLSNRICLQNNLNFKRRKTAFQTLTNSKSINLLWRKLKINQLKLKRLKSFKKRKIQWKNVRKNLHKKMKIKQKETNQNSIILVDFLLDRFHTF